MKRILVLSDTHRKVSSAVQITALMHPDAIIHLGDLVEDAHELQACFPDIPVYMVRGNNDFIPMDCEHIFTLRARAHHSSRPGIAACQRRKLPGVSVGTYPPRAMHFERRYLITQSRKLNLAAGRHFFIRHYRNRRQWRPWLCMPSRRLSESLILFNFNILVANWIYL